MIVHFTAFIEPVKGHPVRFCIYRQLIRKLPGAGPGGVGPVGKFCPDLPVVKVVGEVIGYGVGGFYVADFVYFGGAETGVVVHQYLVGRSVSDY